jgi:hypothetical protein
VPIVTEQKTPGQNRPVQASGPPPRVDPARTERLGAALRANLRRRRQQTEARAQPVATELPVIGTGAPSNDAPVVGSATADEDGGNAERPVDGKAR